MDFIGDHSLLLPLATLVLFVLNFIRVELCCFARLFYCLAWICGLNVNVVCNVMNCNTLIQISVSNNKFNWLYLIF